MDLVTLNVTIVVTLFWLFWLMIVTLIVTVIVTFVGSIIVTFAVSTCISRGFGAFLLLLTLFVSLDRLLRDDRMVQAAIKALDYVKDGMKLGLGSGSTAEAFVNVLTAVGSESRLTTNCGLPPLIPLRRTSQPIQVAGTSTR